MPEKQRSGGGTFWTLVLALLMAAAGIVSLVVMPLLNFVPVVVLAVFAFAGLHYFVWGWWLSKSIHAAEAERQADERQASDRQAAVRSADEEHSRKGSP